MSFSNISATQRQQQEEALKKLLAIGFIASTLLHGVALPLLLALVKPAEFADDAIEIVMLDEPKVEKTKPEPVIPEKVSPPPETFKPAPPPEPTPPEEPPVAATPPPIPEEPPVAATPPPIPLEAPVVAAPPPIPLEAPVAATPPPIPEEPSAIAPKQDLTPPETPPSPIANEPKTPSPDPPKNNSPRASEEPPKSEPPVTQSRPKGAESSADFTADAGNPQSSNSPENNNSPSPSSEPFAAGSGPIARAPTAGPPVTATRPGSGSNSASAIADVTNPAGNPAQSESEISSSEEPFAGGSGPIARAPAAGPPVTATRPGSGRNSPSAIADATNPGGSPSNSASGGSGTGGGGSSDPFGSGSGSVPKPTNPGGGGSPARPSGPAPGTCISCGKPEYPSAARKEGRQGRVQVKFDIDPNGKAFNIEILTSSKYDDFDRAAIKTVEKWKFASSESVIQGKTASITFQLNE
ncbi:energy transducer TonB [Tychonema sp. LEGE 07203]|uniref:energy transducer TonB n=1 Tax=Tychonema sp. LEGE 07203 TaxID=1828671 RepID=UPI0018812CD3|nr:energy transducer TonB [Tychonema sp. LEGE 07203]MBE9092945.1 TonB family protein [Tychonema sp. LEGE 07203]